MAVRVIRVGFATTDTIADVKKACSRTTGAARYMTMEYPVGTDYQVTAGKTFYITHVMYEATGTSVGTALGYGDDGVADGVAAPTNFVQITPARFFQASAADLPASYNCHLSVPAGKYPCVLQADAGTALVIVSGIEL